MPPFLNIEVNKYFLRAYNAQGRTLGMSQKIMVKTQHGLKKLSKLSEKHI